MDRELHTIIDSIVFENIEKHPNILIAARFWDNQRYNAAKVCYRFMRMIDDYIDDRKAKDEAINCMEREVLTERVNEWIGCLVSNPVYDSSIQELTETITRFHIPLQLFHNFARSMLYDIHNSGFETLQDFIEYAEGASVAPASVFVHLCCISEEDGAFRPPDYDVIEVARPCAIFSYIVHIIRDFEQDQQNNLNYFALDILKKHGLLPSDLRKIADGSPVSQAFRETIREYHDLAKHYSEQTLREIEKLSSRLDSRYLFSLHLIYHLYRMVFDRIDIENGTFTAKELNPTHDDIRAKVKAIASTWQKA